MHARLAVPTTTHTWVARAAAMGACAIVLAVTLVVAAPPAIAHGPYGEFQVQRSTVVAPLTVAFRVRLIYTNDTEPVTSGATVTVQGSGPGGSVGPIGMGYTGTDGYYTATVAFPAGGSWAITFLSQNPAAQYAHTEAVPSPAPPPAEPPPPTAPPPTAAPSTTEPPVSTTLEAPAPESTTTTAGPSTTATSGSAVEEIAASPASSNTDASYDYLLVMLGALAAAVALGATSVFAWRGGNR